MTKTDTSTDEGVPVMRDPLLVPIGEAAAHGVDWSDLSTHKTMTCRNHPTAVYLTKNPAIRSVHFVKPCDEAPQAGWPLAGLECPCPFDDLVVVLDPARTEEER
jgi:hypothetical protein